MQKWYKKIFILLISIYINIKLFIIYILYYFKILRLDIDCEMQLIYRIVYISVKEIECYFYRERTKLIKWVPIWLKIG